MSTDASTASLPGEAVEAALHALRKHQGMTDEGLTGVMLAAAQPHIAAAERERLANRQQMVDEVKAELDDAFQFTERDGSRHGHVTREWVQVLIATQAASAGAAERERCAQLAADCNAMYPQACLDDGCPNESHYVHFAALLRQAKP